MSDDENGAGQVEKEEPGSSVKKAQKFVLPWMTLPLHVEKGQGVPLSRVSGLHPQLQAAMLRGGYSELFPVQVAAWRVLAGGMSGRHDLCVAAPTGSGKTLAYALPVLQRCVALPNRAGTRALVVLPTRDLAQQVFQVFRSLCEAIEGVSIGLINGSASQGDEASMLAGAPAADSAATWSSMLPVIHTVHGAAAGPLMAAHSALDARLADAFDGPEAEPRLAGAGMAEASGRGRKRAREDDEASVPRAAAAAQEGAVTVVVATPGRLVHHLEHTPALVLSSLEFLVVDETDRLLRQDYQGWLPKVLAAASETAPSGHPGQIPPLPRRVVKLVVSATLTRDPAKVARLDLHAPRFVALDRQGQSLKLPDTLSEFKVVTSAAQKPTAVVALLRELAPQKTLVFTSSLDATHRLTRLLQACPCIGGSVGEHSSHVPGKERSWTLSRFRSGEISILVASDAFTRGMDVPGVMNVVNYDMPAHANTYVHRAGRTARAGQSGRVFTIVRKEHVSAFKAMLRKADNNFVRDHLIDDAMWASVQGEVSTALQDLSELLVEET